MFERFTDRGRHVVIVAQAEARMLNHNYIGPEHLLLGLLSDEETLGCRALVSLGISLQGVRDRVQEITGQGAQAPTGHIPFTLRAKRVLELALREALQLGHDYVGTEHLLLGLIREGEGVASQVLVRLGCELTRVRQRVIEMLDPKHSGDFIGMTTAPRRVFTLGAPAMASIWKDKMDRYWRSIAGEWFIWTGDQGGWVRSGNLDQAGGGWVRVGAADQWKPGDPEE